MGLDLEMFWGIVVEYNWSSDQGSNDRNAISLYGWKGEARRKFANINAMTFPKIRYVVLTKLQLWPVRRPSKTNGPFHWLLEISHHTVTENVAMCFPKYKGDSLLTTNVSCKCCTVMSGLSSIKWSFSVKHTFLLLYLMYYSGDMFRLYWVIIRPLHKKYRSLIYFKCVMGSQTLTCLHTEAHRRTKYIDVNCGSELSQLQKLQPFDMKTKDQ
jgi:hypothetical protein